jgi:multidrug efflux pump subunit AcrA (membrane-fusion protein)
MTPDFSRDTMSRSANGSSKLGRYSSNEEPNKLGTVPCVLRLPARENHNSDPNSPKIGAAFYVVRITMPSEEIARLKGLKLVPGMPVETFVQTGERTVMSYLVKPLHDQITKAFRER